MTEPKTTKKKAIKSDSPSGQYWYANGKRKTSIARVRLFKGSGKITLNEQPVEKATKLQIHTEELMTPLKLTGKDGIFDVTIKTEGGGTHSQIEAARHGIAKALVLFDENLRTTLKRAGLLSRDSRIKERKKYGLKRARRAPQWAKR